MDALKKYDVIFYMAGSEVVLSSLFLAIVSYCFLDRAKKKTFQPEHPPPGGGGSDTEEAESDIQEAGDHPGDNHYLSHSGNNAGGDAVNHLTENRNADRVGRLDAEGTGMIPGSCHVDQIAERDSF